MSIYILALLIGVVAGLRAMTAPAAVSWAAALGWLDLSGSWASFMGHAVTPYILTLVALGELVTDKLPQTPSRKVPMQFGTRIVTGAFSGAVLATPIGATLIGALLGAVGAVIGTYGGAAFRSRLVASSGGRDLPIALLEDAIAVIGAFLVVAVLL